MKSEKSLVRSLIETSFGCKQKNAGTKSNKSQQSLQPSHNTNTIYHTAVMVKFV